MFVVIWPRGKHFIKHRYFKFKICKFLILLTDVENRTVCWKLLFTIWTLWQFIAKRLKLNFHSNACFNHYFIMLSSVHHRKYIFATSKKMQSEKDALVQINTNLSANIFQNSFWLQIVGKKAKFRTMNKRWILQEKIKNITSDNIFSFWHNQSKSQKWFSQYFHFGVKKKMWLKWFQFNMVKLVYVKNFW